MSLPGAPFFARLLLVLLGVSTALAIVETALRFQAWRSAPPPTAADFEALACVEDPVATAAPQRSRTIMDILRRSSSQMFDGVLYRFNAKGVRGPSRMPQSAPWVMRIVVVGDSVTMGHGVAEDDTYAALLERRLNFAAGARHFEVVNLGLSNANLPSVVDRLRRLGLPLRPDLIVYGFTLNDIEGPLYRRSAAGPEGEAYLQRLQRFSDSRSVLLRTGWPRLMSLLSVLWPPPGSYLGELADNYFDNEAAWRVFEESLNDLTSAAEELDVCLHVLVHTHLFYLNALHPFGPMYEKVEGAARARGLTVTQTLPYFDGRELESLKVSPIDPHPNAAGNRILAEALYDGLARLPERCWRRWSEVLAAAPSS